MVATVIDPHTPQAQLDHACAELVQRLRTGQTCRAEDYLARYPVLANTPDLALELIFTEYVVRHELGDTAPPDAWYARFPQWQERLRRLLNVHGLLSAATNPERASADPAAVEPACMGVYELRQRVAAGGMGIVYRAWDRELRREVALKVIRAGLVSHPDMRTRFRQEGWAGGLLRHPHIVPVYEVGEVEGDAYLVMPFLGGGTFGQHLERYRAHPRAAVTLLAKVARAVAYAHGQGVLHRDLKPANILLDDRGEPYVSDFGLAKLLDADMELTRTGQIVGTPAYMSPEQAACRRDVGPASDVWGLGVLLYEVLTGRRPFDAASYDALVDGILRAAPTPPRIHRPDLDPALEAIVLRCLEKDPSCRYQAAVLAEALEGWLQGQPVLLPPMSRPARTWRRLWQRLGGHARFGFLVGLLTLLAPVSLVVVGSFEPSREEREAQQRQEALRSIERDLALGRQVNLVGQPGGPLHMRWLTEVGLTKRVGDQHEQLIVEGSWLSPTMLELVPRIPCPRYHVYAEIRRGREGPAPQLGIYVAHHEFRTPYGNEQQYCWLAFTDSAPPSRAQDQAQGFFKLVRQRPGSLFRSQLGHAWFPRVPGSWHALECVVTPEGVTGTLDGTTIGSHTWEKLRRDRSRFDAGLVDAAEAVQALTPAGGVGVCGVTCTFTVRRLTITPLP